LQAETAVFPLIGKDAEGRGEKRIVTKLVDADLGQHDRGGDDVAQPSRLAPVKQVDERAVNRPDGNGEKQVAQVLAGRTSTLEEDDEKELRHERTGGDGSNDDEGKAVPHLVCGEVIKQTRDGRTEVITGKQGEHDHLDE